MNAATRYVTEWGQKGVLLENGKEIWFCLHYHDRAIDALNCAIAELNTRLPALYSPRRGRKPPGH